MMSVTVQLATSLREYCHGIPDFELQADSVERALLQIRNAHPELYNSVCNESGEIRSHVHLFVNDSLVEGRSLKRLNTGLQSGDILSIYPAVSGG